MTAKDFITSKSITCPLCGAADSRPFLVDRPDYEYGANPILHYASCKNIKCGFVFVVDAPSIEGIKKFYTQYSTHSPYRPSKVASTIADVLLFVRNRHLKSIFNGRDVSHLNVLDYGCGAGDFMRQLTRLGIKGVSGYDFDPEACMCARALGLKVHSEEAAFQADGPYDFIFLNHVIEHLREPDATLVVLLNSLKRGGRLVLRTPNACSFLVALFGDNWRGWETPRHLYIFNTKSLGILIAKVGVRGLRTVSLSTSNVMFLGMFHESLHTEFWRSKMIGRLLRHIFCFLTLPISFLVNFIQRDLGEEIVLVLELIEDN